MQIRQSVCFYKTDRTKEEEDYSIVFIPSGFKGAWLKVWEHYDYTTGVEYASSEENAELNKQLQHFEIPQPILN
jgi:hypothetical protein